MAELIVRSSLTKSEPRTTPVLIIGQTKHIEQVRWSDIKTKLEPQVTEEIFKTAVSSLHPSPTDIRPLYLNYASVAALPAKCSRHNTPSRAHSISKIVQSGNYGEGSESIVIICEKNDALASACAVARAFPLFSLKTSNNSSDHEVFIEFIIVPNNGHSPPEGIHLTSEEVKTIENVCYGVRLAAKIVDAPCNYMNVDMFLDEIKVVGSALNITPLIIRDEELRKKGLGGIYGVGKAAKCPPALAVLSYTPEGAKNTIAWVGKGIVYDTGGLSLKGKTAMPGMKRDCGGAAGILGAFYAAVKANFTENLHAVFCLAENNIGPNATRPDDIHTLYSGRTVEINNTDAEGRLVLADGVAYANKDLKANIILDMATLTGAQGISTGKYHAAVLTNDGPWEDTLMQAGLVSGDLVFPIPFCPEMHFSEFNSAVADMKNSVADRTNAQASCAGLFIASHLGFEYPGTWIHVDMAYPVHSGERATGYGVALLTTLFGKYCKQPLIQAIAPEVPTSSENEAKKRKTKK